ncbi:hypothetical protein [Metabacillus arenae]|uniref:Uncharacterized protein n=1 Tax=Metabacillus arenae TaxID=2771434 RepID=A0A926N9Y9_9BACI|nr:hypothetical protein [Metabacillus arenae]MBD1379499.1 hypothetical protein [Metabacillus arenae]
MKSGLTPNEHQYVNQILDILKASGVNPSYREDAKIQLVEHIQEARHHNEDFKADLGSPEDFALHFMESVLPKDEQLVIKQTDSAASSNQTKKLFSFKSPIVFILLAGLYYAGLQFGTVLLFTPVLNPELGQEFHLFIISDFLWWNLLAIAINVSIALVLSGLTMYLLGKRYRLS